MPLERRLRDGLADAAERVDADVERHLHQAVGRAHRRVRTRRILTGGAAVALVLGGAVVVRQLDVDHDDARVATDPGPVAPHDSDPDLVAGRYETTIAAGDDALTPGTWTVVLGEDGTMTLDAPPAFTGTRSGLFRSTADVFEVDVFESDLCDGLRPGRYRWTQSATSLTLTVIEDACAPRQRLLTTTALAAASGG